jgi:hypothetical protein
MNVFLHFFSSSPGTRTDKTQSDNNNESQKQRRKQGEAKKDSHRREE